MGSVLAEIRIGGPPRFLWAYFRVQHFDEMNPEFHGGSHALAAWIGALCCGNRLWGFHDAAQCRAARKGDGSSAESRRNVCQGFRRIHELLHEDHGLSRSVL